MINPRGQPCDEGAIRSVRSVPRCVAARRGWILAATILGSSIAFIDGSVVNVALPAIERDLETSVTLIQWIINAYTLCLASLLLVGGAAGDLFGRRRVFATGIALFALASLWCGLAPNAEQLILARAVQGVGAALLIPGSLAIIGASFEEAERGKAIGTWAGFSAVATAIGPLLGGWIVDHASWRLIFLINPIIALPTLWIVLRHVPESRDDDAPASLDWRGAALAFLGLGSVVFGLMASPHLGWHDPTVITAVVVGLLVLLAFLWEERRSATPMLPLTLFGSRTFSGVNLMTLLLYAALGGTMFFLPFLLIQVHGYSATQAGAVFLPFTIIMGALSRWSGGLLDRFGARLPLTIGPLIAAVGFLLLALSGTSGSYWTTFFPPMVALGLGLAVSVAPLTATVLNAVPAHRTGVASGINNAVASVASLLAVAILGAIALSHYNDTLGERAAALPESSHIRQTIESPRGMFAPEAAVARGQDGDRQIAGAIIRDALADSIRLVLLVAAGLALAAAACAMRMIDPAKGETASPRAPPHLAEHEKRA